VRAIVPPVQCAGSAPAAGTRVTSYPALSLFDPKAGAPDVPEPRRRRIWELSSSFHCSIIGTCLTTAELRQILVKMQLQGASKESDHQLHGRAVLLAGQREHASKLLQKALDRRHRSVVNQFSKARNVDELRALWDGAVQRAEIPGAYWAVLTHPQATGDLVRHVFGEVHMLSHLVGAANRADIRRLGELETENVGLQDKVARQQKQLRDAVVSRDATIANLNEMLGKAIASAERGRGAPPTSADDVARETTARLVDDLRRRLASETASRQRIDRRLREMTADLDLEKKKRRALELRECELLDELEAAERSLARQYPDTSAQDDQAIDLAGMTLLYVGGRTHNVVQLRMLAEQYGATLLHHDGGIDDRSGLLASHVARASIVYFPADCVSHNAVAVIKRIARHLGTPYVALRSSGLTSFVIALRRNAIEKAGTNHQSLQRFG
jgi:hypothetical protein